MIAPLMGTFHVNRLVLNGLRHVVLEWRTEDRPKAIVVLLHGYMDAAGTFDLVAPTLTESGFRVFAPHLRGFGEGPWIAEGAYYHFPDYLLDVVALLDWIGEPVHLVGHSMGGTIASLVASTFPSFVRKLVLLEGLGPPSSTFEEVPDRLKHFVNDMKQWSTRRTHRTMKSLDEALARLKQNHPSIPEEVLRSRVPHLTKAKAEGGITWSFDPIHRVHSAFPFFAESFRTCLKRVDCETLVVGGGATGFHPVDEKERIASIARVHQVEIEGAGHMMHWTEPQKLSDILCGFLAR